LHKILGMCVEPAKKTLSEEFAEAESRGRKDAIWELRIKNREEKMHKSALRELEEEDGNNWTYIDPTICSIQ